jgi:hypothetical protein
MRRHKYKSPREQAQVVVSEMKFRTTGRSEHLNTMTSLLGLAGVFRESHTARTEGGSAAHADKKEARFATPSAL